MNNIVKKVGLSVLVASALYGVAPVTINYQGYLKDSSDNAVNGAKSIVFSLYDVSTGGAAIWTSTKNITVTDGVYSTVLGETQVLTGLDFDTQYYLGINVAGDGEMSPRQPLTSTAYAINSTKTEQIGTLTAGKWCSSDGTTVNCTQDAPMLTSTYDVAGDGKIDADKINGSSTNGQVLTTDGSGSVSWQTPASGGSSTNALTLTAISSNTTLTTTDQFVFASGNITITLPATPNSGQILYLFVENQSSSLNLNGQSLFYNATYNNITETDTFTNYGLSSMLIIYNGTKWIKF